MSSSTWQKSLWGMLTGGGSVIIKTAINIFLVPLIIANLGLESFSLYVLLISVYELSMLLDLGATSALITRLSAQEKQSGVRASVLQAGHIWFLVTSTLLLLTGFLMAQAFPYLFHVKSSMLPVAMASMTWVVLESSVALYSYYYEALLLANLSQQWSNMATTGYHLIANVGSLVAVLLGMGLEMIFIIRLFAAGLKLVFVMYKSRVVEPVVNPLPMRFSSVKTLLPELKKLSQLSSHALMINFSIIVSHKIDSFVIATFLPISAVGIYEIVFRFLGITIQICLKVNESLFPLFSSMSSRQNTEGATQLFIRMSSFLFCLAAAIITVITMHYADLFSLFSANKIPIQETLMVLLVAIPTILSGVLQMPANAWLFTSGHQRYLTTTSVLAALANLTLSLILVKPLGIVGVALGTLIPQLLQHQFGLVKTTCNKLNIPVLHYVKQVHVAVLLPVVVCMVWVALWHPVVQYVSFKLFSIALVSATGVMISLTLWFRLTSSQLENDWLKQLLLRKVQKTA